MSRRSLGAHALAGALLLIPLVCLFPRVFFLGEMAAPGGILLQTAPWNRYYADAPAPRNWLTQETLMQGQMWYRLSAELLRGGEWPLWNRLQLGGMPLLANSQSSPLYPPRLLHLVLDPYVATTLLVLLKLWLCGATAYVLGRGIGLRWGPALFLGTGWMLCGYNQLWAYWPLPDISAWAPLALLGVEYLLARRYRKGFWTLALGGALLLLAGHPESAFGQGLGLGLYFFLRLAWERRRDFLKPAAVAGGAWALALALCAAAILPLLEYLPESEQFLDRPEGGVPMEYVPRSALVCFWIPRFWGAVADGNYWGERNPNFVSLVYVGIPVWIAAPLLLTRRFVSGARRARAGCLALTAAFCIAMGFPLAPLRPIQQLPVLDAMWRNYHIPFGLLALVTLGALGVDRWTARPRRPRELAPALAVAAAAAVIVAFYYGIQHDTIRRAGLLAYTHTQLLAAGAAALLCVGVLASRPFRNRPRAAALLLTAVLACDLVFAARHVHPTSPRKHLFFDTELTRFLQSRPAPCRLRAAPSGILPGILQHYGLEQWNGYDGIMPDRPRRFFNTCYTYACWTHTRMLTGIDLWLFREDDHENPDWKPRFETIATIDGVAVARDPEALPRAFLAARVEPVADARSVFQRMCREGFDPRDTVYTEAPPPGALPDASTTDLGTAVITRHASTRVTVEAETAETCALVLQDTYYPGWKVTVDGERAHLFPAFYAFRGVVLPPGRHVVEYTYFPMSFRVGLAISVAAMLGSGLVCAASLRKRPRDNRGE